MNVKEFLCKTQHHVTNIALSIFHTNNTKIGTVTRIIPIAMHDCDDTELMVNYNSLCVLNIICIVIINAYID